MPEPDQAWNYLQRLLDDLTSRGPSAAARPPPSQTQVHAAARAQRQAGQKQGSRDQHMMGSLRIPQPPSQEEAAATTQQAESDAEGPRNRPWPPSEGQLVRGAHQLRPRPD